MYEICVISGTRADYGLLRNLIKRLDADSEICLKLIVTGSHLSDSFGNTQNEIIADGISDYITIPIPLEDDSHEGMACSTGIGLIRFSEYFRKNKPDLLIVLGDRFEAFAAAAAAHLIGVPIAHISGGDVTEGVVDDAIRHCLTKMSNLHFPGCEQSRRRIIQMGEQPEFVFNVGEPGVENCLNMKLLSRNDLAESINFDGVLRDFALVTFHPVTMERDTALHEVRELIAAMDSFPRLSYVVTLANADAGGRAINDCWMEEAQKHKNWLVVPSLGVKRYLSAMKYTKMVLGNSSSGIVEAPSMNVPTVNIGDRQKGRMMAKSVVCCMPKHEDIVHAMTMALSSSFMHGLVDVENPFGDGKTSKRIHEIVLDYLKLSSRSLEKHFYDIDFSIANEVKKCSFQIC